MQMMAEMIGKETGICKGRVGSMHVTDRSVNNLSAQGIIGATFPISIGVGLAIKLKNLNGQILMSFFGDGSTNQGNFYESLNFADIWKVPGIVYMRKQFIWYGYALLQDMQYRDI